MSEKDVSLGDRLQELLVEKPFTPTEALKVAETLEEVAALEELAETVSRWKVSQRFLILTDLDRQVHAALERLERVRSQQ